MPSKVLLTTMVLDFLFAVTGALMVGFSVVVKGNMNKDLKNGEEIARHLVYARWPLDASLANGIMILMTFLLTIPGLLIPTRIWIKLGGFFVIVSAIFTLCIGVYLWVLTLATKKDTFKIWSEQSSDAQSQLELAFKCCGYFNSTSPAFVTNSVCTSPASAALQPGCATPVSSFINVFSDDIFTGLFGMVGIDTVLIVAFACLLKERKENERYRHIDQKTGYSGF
ncbi:hypothetical protein TD95_004674 [Thielaviopsis punctulata]|uniref:Tetraspanin n=1 Tax=Thielaviopsis punctulata TaxID=72032 RepID=A0A0F4ZGA9_9PEZI|nr:hypothetical protein TD95_004674 [Thielaviopsis punctulata]